MIKAQSVSVKLGQRPAVHDVSFTAAPEEFICLVGPNGAGKSTLLRALAGVQSVDAGEIIIGDAPLSTLSYAQRASRVSWLPQARPVAWNLKSEDVVALGRFVENNAPYDMLRPRQKQAVDNAMKMTGADAFKTRQVGNLSGGEQARVHLARSFASPAEYLLLDEPCAALDISHQLSLMQMLAEQAMRGRLVIVAMHDLALAARFATRIIVLNEGKLRADNTPNEALSDACLEDVFSVRLGRAGEFQPVR